MLPQFAKAAIYRVNINNVAVGITIIVIGLFKKTVIADGVAVYCDRIFAAVGGGAGVSFFEAWGAALAYTVQIYFDFSGYVDMATGAAWLFGIRLPVNFYSPYKALNIIDFWRRWHMTLSRFFRDYLYIPLGGNRKGPARSFTNLMVVMLLGGLWHGAGWTFVFWGFLHGLYLVTNHAWRGVVRNMGWTAAAPRFWRSGASWAATFFAVVVAWVFFRADSVRTAWSIVAAMLGHGFTALPDSFSGKLGGVERWLLAAGFTFDGKFIIEPSLWITGMALILTALFVALYFPNSNELFDPERGDRVIVWRPNALSASLICLMFCAAFANLFKVSPFLYFNF
jgi:D-alanyl-lipoteichoic acid acyltransferase DltB (MBOAT superfamily)